MVDGGTGIDTYVLNGTAAGETFQILTRAEAANLGYTGFAANTEIVITRNSTVIAELDNVEEACLTRLAEIGVGT